MTLQTWRLTDNEYAAADLQARARFLLKLREAGMVLQDMADDIGVSRTTLANFLSTAHLGSRSSTKLDAIMTWDPAGLAEITTQRLVLQELEARAKIAQLERSRAEYEQARATLVALL